MPEKLLKSRAKALEESFFARQNEELLEKLRERDRRAQHKKALAEASGISDDAVLDRLIELELCSETVAAAALVPLVEVAWADGEVQDEEREAILKAAGESGISAGSTSHKLLENWLDEMPGPELMDVWNDYIAALVAELDDAARAKLEKELLGRAVAVAEAAGGFLGLGKISTAEERVLKQLERAFR